jgi:hypothetical protein
LYAAGAAAPGGKARERSYRNTSRANALDIAGSLKRAQVISELAEG